MSLYNIYELESYIAQGVKFYLKVLYDGAFASSCTLKQFRPPLTCKTKLRFMLLFCFC